MQSFKIMKTGTLNVNQRLATQYKYRLRSCQKVNNTDRENCVLLNLVEEFIEIEA